jgi:hypothetical protein
MRIVLYDDSGGVGAAWILGLWPPMTSIIMVVLMPVLLLIIAKRQGTFNPAKWREASVIYVGDPLLAFVAMFAAISFRSLPDILGGYWFVSAEWQIGILITGYALCAFAEWWNRFKQSGLSWSSYMWSDIYHMFMYGPIFCIMVTGAIATFYAAFKSDATRLTPLALISFGLIIGAMIAWIPMAMNSAPKSDADSSDAD